MDERTEGVPTGFSPDRARAAAGNALTGISVESIRDYVDHRLYEADLRYNQRARFTEAAQRDKWIANDSRLDGMNEIREAMKDQAATAVSRNEVGQLANTLRSERTAIFEPLRDKLDMAGKPNWALMASAVSIIILMVGGFWTIITLKVEAASAPLSTKVETGISERAQFLERLVTVETRGALTLTSTAASTIDRLQLNERLKDVEAKQNVGLARVQTETATQQAAIREIETQIKGVSSAFNLQTDHVQQLLGVLYARSFEAPLPPTLYRPQLNK